MPDGSTWPPKRPYKAGELVHHLREAILNGNYALRCGDGGPGARLDPVDWQGLADDLDIPLGDMIEKFRQFRQASYHRYDSDPPFVFIGLRFEADLPTDDEISQLAALRPDAEYPPRDETPASAFGAPG